MVTSATRYSASECQVCQLLGLPPTVNTSSVPISPADYARAMNQGTFPWPGDVRSRLGPNSGVHLSVTKKKGIPPPQPRLVDSQPAKPMLTLTVFDKLDLSKPAHTFRLKPGTYGVGRIAKNPVHIPFLCLSRQHASITLGEDGSLKVRDLGSTNKTRRSKNKEDFEVTKPFAANADEVVQNGEWLNFGGDIKSQFSVHIPKGISFPNCQRVRRLLMWRLKMARWSLQSIQRSLLPSSRSSASHARTRLR